MIEVFIVLILVFLFAAFLYWAYLPDYRRNRKEFWRTLVGMPIGMIIGGLGYPKVNDRIKKWAIRDKNKSET